jgi:ABC-type transport system involved in multi-copper enzyme maturation permease subunit
MILSAQSRVQAPHPILIIGRGVFLEILRRRDLYVLIILSLLFVLGIGVVMLVGIENPATANFLLNLGMTLAWFFAHILTLISASRQLTGDMENKTLYPLLAKPLKRSDYFLGKWAAVSLCGIVSLFIFLILGWLPVPKLQSYSSLLFLQTILLYAVSLMLVSALAMFLSLLFPKGASVLLLTILVFAGNKILGFIRLRSLEHPWGKTLGWIISYIPDFSLFNLTTRYTDGIGPLSLWEFGCILFYGVLLIYLFLFWGIKILERRSL